MNAFTIKDLENLSGIKAHTIRIWEQRYSFLKPQRTDTNIRLYTNNDLKLILNIALLNKYGFKISHIDKMSPEEIRAKIYSLSFDNARDDQVINELIQSMVELEMERVDSILNRYISLHSFEKAVLNIIFPFLERIGILWATNDVNPAQEHLISNIIRQKVIVAIEKLTAEETINKTAVLFLPENEHHELGLLFSYYLLKQKGITVLYLGGSVPLKDLEYTVKRKRPDFLYSHITVLSSPIRFEKYFSNLKNQVGNIPVIISGQIAQQYKKPLPEQVILKKSLEEVQLFINSLSTSV